MADLGGTKTEFDKHAPAEMLLYLRLLKLRRNPSVLIESSNADLQKLTGLTERTFRRARLRLVNWGLITDVALGKIGEVHRYEIIEPEQPYRPDGTDSALCSPCAAVDIDVVPISQEKLLTVLSPVATLKGKDSAA
jgi:hypothetical protein